MNLPYTVKNPTDLLQVLNFTGLLQLVNKLQQTRQFHQVAKSLLKSGLLQLVICTLVTTCWNNLQQIEFVDKKFGEYTWNKSVDNL